MPVAWVAFDVRCKEKWIVNGDANLSGHCRGGCAFDWAGNEGSTGGVVRYKVGSAIIYQTKCPKMDAEARPAVTTRK